MEQFELDYAEITPVSAANAIDPKLADGAGTTYNSDATIGAGGIWTNVLYNLDVTGTYSGDVDGTPYDFTGYVEGDSQTNETVHEKINYLWRQPVNVNTDGTGATLRGDKQWPMTTFVGDGFTVEAYLENYNAGALVEASRFAGAIKNLKSQIHSLRRNNGNKYVHPK